MARFLRGSGSFAPGPMRGVLLAVAISLATLLSSHRLAVAQIASAATSHEFFIDCSGALAGDGSRAHPWNSLAAAQDHAFVPGDRTAIARGSTCHGSFAPQGSGAEGKSIRLTAYGEGPRPKIVAGAGDRQALLLFNQEYWQIDSLDVSGGGTYGIFVTGDKGPLHQIRLENLYVHDVRGGAMKNKDNGLVVVGPSSRDAIFSDVIVDGVVAAHTTEWAGILIGGGSFGMDAPPNPHVTVRNSSVHDVYGDGIVLFRDSDGLIENSIAWETGMQPTQTVGTPDAIWTWTCTDCTVRDNEAFLTDSPGVDGGAYDIDWNNTRNTVERNYAHDTQGYCIAVFAAGYVTSDSVVRDNLCVDNARSPRLAALQGAMYLHTWDGGVIRGLRVEHNIVIWNPPAARAAAVVEDASISGEAVTFAGNRIESSAPIFYRTNAQFAPAANTYRFTSAGEARFTLGDWSEATLAALQAAGLEKGSVIEKGQTPEHVETPLRLDATVEFSLDGDGLLSSASRAQLMVLRSLAAQYSGGALDVTVHLCEPASPTAGQRTDLANALLDLDAPQIRFLHDGQMPGRLRLFNLSGELLKEWSGFQNAAALGAAVRARLGAPRYAAMEDEP